MTFQITGRNYAYQPSESTRGFFIKRSPVNATYSHSLAV